MPQTPANAGANPPHKPSNPPKNTSAAIVEALIVDLFKEARRQLAMLSTSKTGGDTLDAKTNRENIKLRAANAGTLAQIVAIVRQITELTLQLETMGSTNSARKAARANQSLQRKLVRAADELRSQGALAPLDG